MRERQREREREREEGDNFILREVAFFCAVAVVMYM